jgi:DNA polymerase-3 subunit epsilon
MRIIALDTETTGLNPHDGHRVIEIGAVEIMNGKITGHKFQTYLNPGRASDQRALEIHGLTEEFLKNKPEFKDIINEFERFINCSTIVIHNATFDVSFLSAEHKNIGIINNRYENYLNAKPNFERINQDILCSKRIADIKYPKKKSSLDALAERFNITGFDRTKHSALVDAEILAHVYLKLTDK